MKKRIYIDMDNTLCNYAHAHQKSLEKEPEIIYPQSQYGFFANLEPIKGAVEAFHILGQKFEVYILTAPSYLNPMCYTEKRVWVEKYLGAAATPYLIICKRKGLLKGDFLIDDIAYNEFEGTQILFGQTPFENWGKVLTYFSEM